MAHLSQLVRPFTVVEQSEETDVLPFLKKLSLCYYQTEDANIFTRIQRVTEAGQIVHPEGGVCLCHISLQYLTKTAEHRGVGSGCGEFGTSGTEEAGKTQTLHEEL